MFIYLKKKSAFERGCKVTTTFLTLIMTLSNLIFNYAKNSDKRLLHEKHLYMFFWKSVHGTKIYLPLEELSQIYLKFIDDILFIWTYSENDLLKFLNKLNKVTISSIWIGDIQVKNYVLIYGVQKSHIQKYAEKKLTNKHSLISNQTPYITKNSALHIQALQIERIR